jgi:hypothetical protein
MGQSKDHESSRLGRAVYVALALTAASILGLLVGESLAGGSRTFAVAGVEATVRHGPTSLAMLAVRPPAWLMTAIVAGLGVLAVLTAAGYRRHGLTDEVKAEAAANVLAGVGALTAAHVVGSVTAWPWPAQVAVAGTTGWLAARGLSHALDARLSRED